MSRGIEKMKKKINEKKEKEAEKTNEEVESHFRHNSFVSGVAPRVRPDSRDDE